MLDSSRGVCIHCILHTYKDVHIAFWHDLKREIVSPLLHETHFSLSSINYLHHDHDHDQPDEILS